MKAATTALQNFLESNQGFVVADLYTFTLVGGVVVRWSGAGLPVTIGGNVFAPGPRLVTSGIRRSRGIQVDTLDLDIYSDSRHTIGSTTVRQAILNKSFDSAALKIERAYASSWQSPWVGSVIRFMGRVSEVQSLGRTATKLAIASGLEVLSNQAPPDVYQASCLNTVYDSKCTLSPSSFSHSGTVSSGASTITIPTNISGAAGAYAGGTVTITSGALAGEVGTIKSSDGSGNLTLSAPLLGAPAPGDSVTVYLGCDLSLNTCVSRFNNAIHFRGQPFIPVPETTLGGTGSTGSTSTESAITSTGIGGGLAQNSSSSRLSKA